MAIVFNISKVLSNPIFHIPAGMLIACRRRHIMRSFQKTMAFLPVILIILSATSSCSNTPSGTGSISRGELRQVESELFERRDEILASSDPQPQDYGQLVFEYVSRYLVAGGDRLPELEEFLDGNIPVRAAGYSFVNLARAGAVSPFADQLRGMMSSEDEQEQGLFYHAGLIYDTGRIVQKEQKSREDWEAIVTLMEEARALRPTVLYKQVLLTAYRELGRTVDYFTLLAYRFADEGAGSGISAEDLQGAYDGIENPPASYEEMYRGVIDRLVLDYHRGTNAMAAYALSGATFIDPATEDELVIDPADPASPAFGKSLIVSIFSLDCPYCIEELQILSQVAQEVPETTFIIGLHVPRSGEEPDLREHLADMAEYARRHDISFPCSLTTNRACSRPWISMPRHSICCSVQMEN
jgi:thiol-disulfide isomerase/thioredoxin